MDKIAACPRLSGFLRLPRLRCLAAALFLACAGAQAADCTAGAADACYQAMDLPGGARFHYYASRSPGDTGAAPTRALVVLHGHPRDANTTFDAALSALRGANAHDTLVIAPLFQVEHSGKCDTPGLPAAQDGDALWTCGSWIDGGAARRHGPTAFAALDALVAQVRRQWPGLTSVTVAGFSAGAQLVQHYIGFADIPARAPGAAQDAVVRFVVADPGTWLYFDAARPQLADAASCPDFNSWKYGVADLAAADGRSARARYAAADVRYLEGALDARGQPGSASRILDQSCAAQAQGADRLSRGRAYADYDRAQLAGGRHLLSIVPGCAHDVSCVFTAPAARAALLER